MVVAVVDSDNAVRRQLKDILAGDGFTVRATASIQEIQSLLESGCEIGLIVTELVFPESDGFVLLRYLNSNLRFRDIPVLICTSIGDNETVFFHQEQRRFVAISGSKPDER